MSAAAPPPPGPLRPPQPPYGASGPPAYGPPPGAPGYGPTSGPPGYGPPPAAPGYGPPSGPPAYGQPAYGQPAYGPPAPGQTPYGPPPGYGPPGAPHPPVRRRSRAALWWSLGAVASVLVLGLVLVLVVRAAGDRTEEVQAVELSMAAFEVPRSWEVRPAGENVTNFDLDSGVVHEEVTYAESAERADGGRVALVEYYRTPVPEPRPTPERIDEAMDQGLAGQLAATPEQLVSMRESSGHGCVSDVAYTDEPTRFERDGLVGYDYGYTCQSLSGPVTGRYAVAYDEDGVTHRLTVSTLDPYADEHADVLQAVTDSLRAG